MANERRYCDTLPSKQAVAGSSPVSRSTYETVSLEEPLKLFVGNRIVMEVRADGFCARKKAFSDNLPPPSSLPGCPLLGRKESTCIESQQPPKPSKHVTEARAAAQRAKLGAQAEPRRLAAETTATTPKKKGKYEQQELLTKRRARMTIGNAIEDYLLDHEGGNHSVKTLQ